MRRPQPPGLSVWCKASRAEKRASGGLLGFRRHEAGEICVAAGKEEAGGNDGREAEGVEQRKVLAEAFPDAFTD